MGSIEMAKDSEEAQKAQDSFDLDKYFKTYPPIGDKPTRFDEIRNAARFMAEMIIRLAPKCADRTASIRKVREAVWTVNYAIASDDDDGRYMKTMGYDPKTELAPIHETLKRDSWDLLSSWIEGNMQKFVGVSEMQSGETTMEFCIRIMELYKEHVAGATNEKSEKQA